MFFSSPLFIFLFRRLFYWMNFDWDTHNNQNFKVESKLYHVALGNEEEKIEREQQFDSNFQFIERFFSKKKITTCMPLPTCRMWQTLTILLCIHLFIRNQNQSWQVVYRTKKASYCAHINSGLILLNFMSSWVFIWCDLCGVVLYFDLVAHHF